MKIKKEKRTRLEDLIYYAKRNGRVRRKGMLKVGRRKGKEVMVTLEYYGHEEDRLWIEGEEINISTGRQNIYKYVKGFVTAEGLVKLKLI